MARPTKQGLDYFPLDVGFLRDIKTRRIMKACGTQSIPVLISLLGSIYRDKGYYMQWDNDMPFLIADEVGISEGAVTETVEKAVQVDFFNSVIWKQYAILTSAGIQRRFFEAVSRRSEVHVRREILLIDISDSKNLINVSNNPINAGRNEQSKEKESKGKKSKEYCYTDNTVKQEPALSEAVQNACLKTCGGIGPSQYDQLTELIRIHGEARVVEALAITQRRGQRRLSYAAGILRNWKKDGYDGTHESGGHSGGDPEKRNTGGTGIDKYRNITGL